jgi:heptose-I-phosphate ethanolaminephosphotransferase
MHSRSIIGNLGKYGYETHWISAHAPCGLYDTINSSMADEAKTKFFANIEFNEGKKKTDIELVNCLRNLKEQNASAPQMYFIHLLGSHFKYEKRFTEDVALIKKAVYTKDIYDNTIHYTDFVLKNIFAFFQTQIDQGKKVLFVYSSDHGEFIGENLEIGGHGRVSPFKDEYEIPFIVYSTIENKRIDVLLKKNQKGYFNLENLNYMIEYISGIREDANISYSSKVMAAEPSNIYDYNRLKFYKNN